MRILDLMCPVGRGQRGLIVAPPRSGKTILLRKFADAIEKGYPDVHLMVLLVDERPEEATEWKRARRKGRSSSAPPTRRQDHVQLAEAVWKRAHAPGRARPGRRAPARLDHAPRARLQQPRAAAAAGRCRAASTRARWRSREQFFGSARNTERAGSLTILGTTLVDTGSRMDQLIFEEFKGTGNMELVLSRKLADRRIFPAIDIEQLGHAQGGEALLGASA